MSTRGIIGVYIDGESKLSFNHYDSYPMGLGIDVLNDVSEMVAQWSIEKMRSYARRLTLVDSKTPLTDSVIKEFRQFTEDFKPIADWNDVLHPLQGKLMDTLVAGFTPNDNDFIVDSLFCEWGYVLNLDDNLLEIYKGFQKEPHDKGRYAKIPVERGAAGYLYYPCALHVTFPLDDLPETEQEFIVAINCAGFDSVESVVLDHLECGKLSEENAAVLYGIDHLGEVIESLEEAGYKIEFDGDEYFLTKK